MYSVEAGSPNITGGFSCRSSWATNKNGGWDYKTGAFSGNTGTYPKQDASISDGWGPRLGNLEFRASLSSSIYGNSETVTPSSLKTLLLIRY